jgi:hypothetical protein
MNRAWPSRNDKSKPHIEVTYGQDILTGIALSARVLYNLIWRHYNRYVRTIYCSYAVVEVWSKPGWLQLSMHGSEFRV